jgi:hypothetical protein
MKTLMIAAATAALALAAPAVSHAQEVYTNLGYASYDIDPVNLGAIGGRIGVRINDHFAVEGEAGFGVADDDVLGTSVELSNEYGAYLMVLAPVSESTDIFARAGFASGELDVGGTSVSDDGGAYGVGVQHFFNENNGIRFDWTHYDFGSDSSSWSLSWVHTFN